LSTAGRACCTCERQVLPEHQTNRVQLAVKGCEERGRRGSGRYLGHRPRELLFARIPLSLGSAVTRLGSVNPAIFELRSDPLLVAELLKI
jgi:hypothetical protein